MTKRKLVLFDIDGTILLSAGAGRRAITKALTEAIVADTAADPAPTLAASFAKVRFDGKTDPQIVGELLEAAGHPNGDEARVHQLCRRYIALLEHELGQHTTVTEVMPGIPALLDRLEAEASVVLGLLTGNVADGAALKLRHAGIDASRFRLGAYGSDAPHRPLLPPIAARRAVPHFGREPSGAEVVIIGDTPADVACGASIGARAIAVATGPFTLEQLNACDPPPHAAFADLRDTDRVLTAILD